jgi:pilus assembly protein CpaE
MPEKILVVDDDVDTLRLVGLMLQRQGYEIVAASSGRQALSMARSEEPELIILDVMMPDMDGYEVTRRLRADQATASIPIIMFTAKTQIDDKVTGFEAGADDYLTKPTQPRELFAHVKAVLARTAKGRGAQPAGAATAAAERGHVVGLLAAKGGLGVTTLALNLGITLRAKTQKNVIIAEYRPGQGSIGLDLGYLRPQGLNQLLERKPAELNPRTIEPHLITHSSGVQLLLSSYQASDARYQANAEHFEAITRALAFMAHMIVIDLGPALPPITDKVIPLCDQLVVVAEPHPHSTNQTKLLLQDLATKGFGQGRVRAVLVNRARSDTQMTWSQVQEELGVHLSVIFTPAPEILYQAAIRNAPVAISQPDSLTVQQFNKLTDLVLQPIAR